MDETVTVTNETNPDTGSMTAVDTGVAVNGNANDSTINSNQNSLSTGNNTNLNLLTPTLYSPSQSAASGGVGGTGGNAVLMLPRNPLPLSNASVGRSNFGLQFGLQNNPILGGLGGRQNALGWFLQGGITVPFGKIPDVFRSANNSPLDEVRQQMMEKERNIFGELGPKPNSTNQTQRKVKGRITGISAFNYSTLPTGKIDLPAGGDIVGQVDDAKLSPPKLLALASAAVFNKPLNTGEKVGVIQVGSEYPYLGHTRSGWIKILLQNGTTGWTSTRFEYIKQDYTEIDDLALAAPVAEKQEKSAHADIKPPQASKASQKRGG